MGLVKLADAAIAMAIIAVSGGLLVSTTLTLFVVPAILSLVRLRGEE